WKISLGVLPAGPSDVITRNFVSGSRSPTLMGIFLVLSVTDECVLSSPARAKGSAAGTAPAQISAPGELVETGHDLDRGVARDCCEREGSAVVCRAGGRAIEIESEALQAFRRAVDRHWHGQRPLRRRARGERGGRRCGRRCDVNEDAGATACCLAPNRFDGKRRTLADRGLVRKARFGRGERGVVRGEAAAERQLG